MQPSHTPPLLHSLLDPYLPSTSVKHTLEQQDTLLIQGLYEKNEPFIKNTFTTSYSDLHSLLAEKKTLSIPIIRWHNVDIDGQTYPLALIAATDTQTNHGEMSSMLYLRDHIQTARVFMELSFHDPRTYMIEKRVGRDLILSALHLLSTPSQLNRFHAVIQKGVNASQEDWPHISLWFDDLQGEKPNGWRNKQDTFQMLAHLALDALDHGYMHVDDLLPSHKTFLGLIAPLLKSVDFPHYENSGSWEEITAVRTSVMAIETALLHKIKTMSSSYSFLKENMPSFEDTIDTMLRDGLTELGVRLPNESPEYPKDSIKYRQADAALAYVLLYGLPQLLAEAGVPVKGRVRTSAEIEDIVLASLRTLDDPLTGGMLRYHGDSYQRVNFHTEATQATIHGIKAFVKEQSQQTDGIIDLDAKQSLRNQYTPQGREAAWTHPLGQVAAWAARRYLESPDADAKARYKNIRDAYIHRMLGTITTDRQWHATRAVTGHYQVQQVAAWRLPECYITYQLPGREPLVVPSPHTPLNWSSASLKEAIGLSIQP